MKKIHFKAFLEKIRFKYRVSILNENTLEETVHFRLSRFNVFLATCILITLCFVIDSFLIIKTPLKQFLPGYENTGARAEYIHNAIVVDSLYNHVKKQDEYIAVLRNILSGDLKTDKVVSLDSLALKNREQVLLTKQSKEKKFCDEFEDEEQYNLSAPNTTTPKSKNTSVFFKPAKGIISDKYNSQKSHYGIDVITAPNENIVSILNGTVIYTVFTLDDVYVIAIQHEIEFISIYKNNSHLLKSIGSNVKAGESIAIAGNTGKKTTQTHIHFELWQKGKPLNPEEYIIF